MLRSARLATSVVAFAAVASACGAKQAAEEQNKTPVFISGTVLNDGKPVKGADVLVQLRDERASADAQVGDSIPMLTADQVHTDSAGSFTLRVDPAKVPTNFYLSGHDRSTLNYELDVATPSAWVPWSGTMYWNDEVWRSESGAVAADQSVTLKVDLGTQRLAATDSLGQTSSNETLVIPRP